MQRIRPLATEEKSKSRNLIRDHHLECTNIVQIMMFAIQEYLNLSHQVKRTLHFHQLTVVLEESARISSNHPHFLRMELQLWVVVYTIAIVKRISIITEVGAEAQVLKVVIIT